MFLAIITSLILGWSLWSFLAMEINYRRASAMGIPLVRLAVDPLNLIWLLLEPTLWRLLDYLSLTQFFGDFAIYSRRGWHFKEKARSHVKFGPVWALVTPCDIYVNCADPGAIHEIFTRRGEFLRPSKMYKILEVYGPCISTASWTDWPRHRKVLATPFNENVMKYVWQESLGQARDMLKSWTQDTKLGSISTAKDTRNLSLNVLAATGFRKSYKFHSSNELQSEKKSGEELEAQGYRDALQTVLDNTIPIMIAPSFAFKLPFLPRSWKRIGQAATEFKKYMENMLKEETVLFEEGKAGSGSLMTSFVRALGVSKKEAAINSSKQQSHKGLSVEEIFGNIFVINFAGHDTTANTLAFSMILLAAHPEVQEWCSEELQAVLSSDDDIWEYELFFEKLKRCRAVLLETLRLFPPIMSLPKWTNESPQVLQVGGKTIVVPPRTGVMPSVLAVHTLPKYWKEPLQWNPNRWISSSPGSTDLAGRLESEYIITPPQHTYFPWSDGPQNCPGLKFSQVEFVAVLSVLLKNHRVGVVPLSGETSQQARERALAVTQDCNMELLLRMRDADQARLVWKEV